MARLIEEAHVAPTYISLQDAKQQLRFDDPAAPHPEDTLIQAYIDAAYDYAENYTGQEITEKIYTVQGKSWEDALQFNRQKIQSIQSITYRDVNGDAQTVAAENYQLATVDKFENKIEFLENFEFPEVQEYRFDAVTITLKVGYATAKLPKNMRIGLYLLIAHYYENRQDAIKERCTAAENMLYKYKRH